MMGPRIAALRRAANMSQAELAQRLRISASAMGMYEQGRREPSADTLVAMAAVLNVSTDYLLTGQARTPADVDSLEQALRSRIAAAEKRLRSRQDTPFTQQELALLLAALLMEP